MPPLPPPFPPLGLGGPENLLPGLQEGLVLPTSLVVSLIAVGALGALVSYALLVLHPSRVAGGGGGGGGGGSGGAKPRRGTLASQDGAASAPPQASC